MRRVVLSCCALLVLTASACRTPGPGPDPGPTTTGPTTVTTPPGGTGCDRTCLAGALDGYLDALVARDPSRLEVAEDVRFTEDNVVRQLGEGLWRTATGRRGYRQDVLDVRAGVAGTQTVLSEGARPVLFSLRLRLVDRRITEIETVVVRNAQEGNSIFAPDNLESASPAMNVVPPPAQRDTRAEQLRIADLYARGLKAGSFVEADTPFAPGAYRLENGARMAGPGCVLGALCTDIRTGFLRENPALTYRVAAVDEEQGIVWLALNFRSTGPGTSLFVWEMFKIYDGRIHAVEAFMKSMPTGPVW